MSYIGKQPRKAALTSSDIEDGIITAAKIEDGAVVAAEIASNAVTTAKINADAVTAAKIADNAVVTAGINADAVTGAKIADDAINSEHYTDGSIDTAHIAADQITNAKIADDQIDSEHYVDGSIDIAHLADNAITLAKMAHGTDGNIISFDANGAPVAIATGSDGQVLTSTGAGSPPAFEAASGGVNTPCFEVSLGSDQDIDNSETSTKITFDTEAIDSDGKFASNRFTPTVAGTYFISLTVAIENGTQGETDLVIATIKKNGSTVTASDARVDFRGNRARGASVTANAVIVFDTDDYVEGFAAHAAASGTTKIKTFGSRMGGFKLIT